MTYPPSQRGLAHVAKNARARSAPKPTRSFERRERSANLPAFETGTAVSARRAKGSRFHDHAAHSTSETLQHAATEHAARVRSVRSFDSPVRSSSPLVGKDVFFHCAAGAFATPLTLAPLFIYLSAEILLHTSSLGSHIKKIQQKIHLNTKESHKHRTLLRMSPTFRETHTRTHYSCARSPRHLLMYRVQRMTFLHPIKRHPARQTFQPAPFDHVHYPQLLHLQSALARPSLCLKKTCLGV